MLKIQLVEILIAILNFLEKSLIKYGSNLALATRVHLLFIGFYLKDSTEIKSSDGMSAPQ